MVPAPREAPLNQASYFSGRAEGKHQKVGIDKKMRLAEDSTRPQESQTHVFCLLSSAKCAILEIQKRESQRHTAYPQLINCVKLITIQPSTIASSGGYFLPLKIV